MRDANSEGRVIKPAVQTIVLGLALFTLAGCDESSESGTGKLRVMLQAEATITEGLDQGADVENTSDYDVRYSKFLVTVGNVKLAKSGSGSRAALPDVFIADLRTVGEQGVELGVLNHLEAGQWDELSYQTPRASKSTKALGDVDPHDVAKMQAKGWTYWIEGKVLRDSKEGGPVSFVIQADANTVYANCELDGEPGVSIVANGTATATLTLHGDHLFFNSFPTGSEGNIKRLAGWVIQADTDLDGKVSTEDLLALDASEVFISTAGYSLDGKPRDLKIETALDFVRAQLTTQGHLNGEGECLSRYNGDQD